MFTVLHNVSRRIPCSCMKQIICKQIMVLISHIVVGTLGYVMSELEDGKPLSQVVKAAKSLGFTEPGSYDIFCFAINHIFGLCILWHIWSMQSVNKYVH